MSLRPEVYGFRLDKLTDLLGSGSKEAVAAIHEALEQSYADVANDVGGADELAEAKKIASKAILKGVPFARLQGETNAHVSVAIEMASFEQEWRDTNSSIWQVNAFWELDPGPIDPSSGPIRMDSGGYKHISVFTSGRPLFGQYFDTGWTHYGYLTRAEIPSLLEAMQTFRGGSAELVDAVAEWMADIVDNDLDMWLIAR